MKRKKVEESKHFKNKQFLQALGEHCRRLRFKKGYSMNRFCRESDDNLSSSLIHRLENGEGAVTILSLYRYAQILQLEPKELLDFPFQASENKVKFLPLNDSQLADQAFLKYLPVYSLGQAVEKFGFQQIFHDPQSWIELSPAQVREYTEEVFVCQIVGHAMSPKIQPGQYVVFRRPNDKERPIAQDKIVLASYRGLIDQETQGNFTVRMFRSSRIASTDIHERKKQVTLLPINPHYESLLLYPQSPQDFQVIGEFLFVVG